MTELPSGTVTFLFTDIEGSTGLLKKLGRDYDAVLAEHQRILRDSFEAHNGREVDTQGDSFFAAFGSAGDAVASAVDAQQALADHQWPEGGEVRVRIGLHTGEPRPAGERYVGFGVHRRASARWATVARSCCRTRRGSWSRTSSRRTCRFASWVRSSSRISIGRNGSQLDVDGLPSTFPPLKAPQVAEPRHVRRRTLLAALGVVLAAAAAAISFVVWTGSSDDAVARDHDGGHVLAVDATTGEIGRRIPAGRTPTAVAAGEGGLGRGRRRTHADPGRRRIG